MYLSMIIAGCSISLGGKQMPYQDIRIHSFNLSPDQTNDLYNKRYNGESTIRLGFDVKGYDSFVVYNLELSNLISSIYQADKNVFFIPVFSSKNETIHEHAYKCFIFLN